MYKGIQKDLKKHQNDANLNGEKTLRFCRQMVQIRSKMVSMLVLGHVCWGIGSDTLPITPNQHEAIVHRERYATYYVESA